MMKIMLILTGAFLATPSMFSFMSTMVILLMGMALFTAPIQEFHLSNSTFMWDTLSTVLITLTLLITLLMALASLSNTLIMSFKKMFLITLLTLAIILTSTFSIFNLVLFYIFFEASLIPTFMLILGWGSQPERLQAGLYMLLYTILASLPLLVSILVLSNFNFTSSISLMYLTPSNFLLSLLMSISLIMAFFVKLPLFLVHLWLPKAHVEAPVAGSMILAAILLKLGGYGALRFISKFHPLLSMASPLFLSWSLVGGSLVAIICLFQSDIKFLIALSSVAHMALVVGGIFTMSPWGVNGAMFIMVGHGFCSSGLFFMANIIYERLNSRSLLILKGLQLILPPLAMMWFLMCTSNMATPPSLNLLGEMNGIISLLPWSLPLTPALALTVFMAAAYSLYLYAQMQHGKMSIYNKPIGPVSAREWLVSTYHWAPLNLLFLSPYLMQIYL